MELLVLLLGASRAGRLARRGPIPKIARMADVELRGDLREHQVQRFRVAVEIGRRAVDEPLTRGASIRSADDVYSRLRARMMELEQEELHVLGLDTLNQVVCHYVCARGSLNVVHVNPREVFRVLVRERIHAAIVVHNHPSGSPAPSIDDKQLTVRLKEAGELLGVPLLDHVIVARSGRYSFAESWSNEGNSGNPCGVV